MLAELILCKLYTIYHIFERVSDFNIGGLLEFVVYRLSWVPLKNEKCIQKNSYSILFYFSVFSSFVLNLFMLLDAFYLLNENIDTAMFQRHRFGFFVCFFCCFLYVYMYNLKKRYRFIYSSKIITYFLRAILEFFFKRMMRLFI